MKSLLISLLCLLVSSIYTSAQSDQAASSKELQKWIKLEKEETRAKTNDKVLVVVMNIKDEAKEEHDAWIKDVLYAALYSSKSEMKKAQLKATRWLTPQRQNENGSWTYCWIMDPMIPDTNYDIQIFLVKEYGEEIGMKHLKEYQSFFASPPQSLLLEQTDF